MTTEKGDSITRYIAMSNYTCRCLEGIICSRYQPWPKLTVETYAKIVLAR